MNRCGCECNEWQLYQDRGEKVSAEDRARVADATKGSGEDVLDPLEYLTEQQDAKEDKSEGGEVAVCCRGFP